ncbi:aspartyl-phosphate phosphatase Spo0E family protein [Paenibacillus methanolicus]|uniref:Spo0E like sporulation regulatory protein n=1 Tax=Paenibacillus methanolicus TaxID=582686 RepID=A0A5S5BRG5_9BACL|nr:Spo0E like sporulation regulatory protein [Paenibacillus methanolicus]
MACADYEFSFRSETGAIQAKQYSSSIRVLEDEIYELRQRMEQSYLEQKTFSSDIVIDLSRKLDIKINEYMRFMVRRNSLQ